MVILLGGGHIAGGHTAVFKKLFWLLFLQLQIICSLSHAPSSKSFHLQGQQPGTIDMKPYFNGQLFQVLASPGLLRAKADVEWVSGEGGLIFTLKSGNEGS